MAALLWSLTGASVALLPRRLSNYWTITQLLLTISRGCAIARAWGQNPPIAQRIDMMTSSNGNIFRVTGHLCGEFTDLRWIPHTKASDAELWWFLWSANKRLIKQWRGWWLETLSRPLWRHHNGVSGSLWRFIIVYVRKACSYALIHLRALAHYTCKAWYSWSSANFHHADVYH